MALSLRSKKASSQAQTGASTSKDLDPPRSNSQGKPDLTFTVDQPSSTLAGSDSITSDNPPNTSTTISSAHRMKHG